jgi:hypothetical protein
MTDKQLKSLCHALIAEAKIQNDQAKPGDPHFNLHMTATLVLTSFADVVMRMIREQEAGD